ncbi:unnamed protein product [Diplocarpon coronariae]
MITTFITYRRMGQVHMCLVVAGHLFHDLAIRSVDCYKDPCPFLCAHDVRKNQAMGGTDTGSSVFDWVATKPLAAAKDHFCQLQGYVLRDREFSQVVSNHLGLNFNLVKFLSGVDSDNAANHFWNDNHVTEMGLDEVWLLVGSGLLLRLTKLLDQTHGLALETAVETTTSAGVDDITELVG